MKKRILFMLSIYIMMSNGYRFREIGSVLTGMGSSGSCYDVIILDTLAFLACDGLPIINIARPDSPFIICHLDSHAFHSVHAIYVNDTILYSVNSGVTDPYLKAYNIKNLPQSNLIDSVILPQGIERDMEYKSGYLYIAEGYLHSASAVNPDSLCYLGVIDSTFEPYWLIRDSSFLYSELNTGVFVYDLTNPFDPIKVSVCSLTRMTSDFSVKDSILFVCLTPYATEHPVNICTISKRNPYNPYILAQSPLIGQDVLFAGDLTLSGNFAYATISCNLMTDRKSVWDQPIQPQVAVFDISDPGQPQSVWIWEQEHGDNYRGIASRADTIYVCNGPYFTIYVDSGWSSPITEISDNISENNKLFIHPNPFRNITSIKTTPDISTIIIYDCGGRLVRRLTVGNNRPNIIDKITWNGRDNDGQRLLPGVYFIVGKGKRESTTGSKVILID